MPRMMQSNPNQNQKGKVKEAHRVKSKDFESKMDEWDQKIVELARVTRVTKGGKRMRFRACVLVGNRKGQVGVGVSKGADVSMAVSKATTQAHKNLISVPVVGEGTIPHRIIEKYGASIVMLKPAPKGSGIIAGGVVRLVMELAGVQNVVSKMMGSKNKINNSRATIIALEKLNLGKATMSRVAAKRDAFKAEMAAKSAGAAQVKV